MPNKDPDKRAAQAAKNTRNKRGRYDAVATALGYSSHYTMLTAMKDAHEAGELDRWLTDRLTDYYQGRDEE